jgi:hypothetical protein
MSAADDALQRRQFQSALRAAEKTHAPVQPTAEEACNGWTPETLTAYLAEQTAAQTLRTDPSSVLRRKGPPMRANSKYRPLTWRRG